MTMTTMVTNEGSSFSILPSSRGGLCSESSRLHLLWSILMAVVNTPMDSLVFAQAAPPGQNLYLYHGVLRYKDTATGEKKQEPVTINETLLRGCAIRNTTWIIGLVVFTGADTKIMLNRGATPSKRSEIEKETNFNVIVNFGVLVFMCTIAAIFNGLQDAQTGTSAEFFDINSDATESPIVNAIITFVSCLIAFQNIVPISLYISIEIVKTIQAYFISQDVDMCYQPYDMPCVPKTWNISDDLGQIEYVFSDKTGTLTQNIMEFQKCSVHGVAYGEGVTEAQCGAATREGNADSLDPRDLAEKLAALKQQMLSVMERTFKNRYLQPEKLTLVSSKLAQDLADLLSDKPEPQESPYYLDYKAESPDEAALVAATRDVGFPFVKKSKDTFDIEVMGQSEFKNRYLQRCKGGDGVNTKLVYIAETIELILTRHLDQRRRKHRFLDEGGGDK
ncbi:uncharacterized protein ARMOST_12305 [Armillaria ostoyae]|uniref:P-type phospholipid transporter n=1 Tax=Armillaria ostoyae TaxID=47428 RepID=A0A284RJL7_ARMOS|nr:uncharacterized protein ARMOST_12305 [Armillaria ostoyae]